MLQALCEEINGSAKLSDVKRDQLRSMFADIIAEEEAEHASAAPAGAPPSGARRRGPTAPGYTQIRTRRAW